MAAPPPRLQRELKKEKKEEEEAEKEKKEEEEGEKEEQPLLETGGSQGLARNPRPTGDAP